MAIGDQVGKQTVEEIDEKTIPEIDAEGKALLDRFESILNGAIDRLNGVKITITVEIPPKKG